MSKASQRKLSSYQLGREDGRKGYGLRWKRHPYLADYKRGHRRGLREFWTQQETVPVTGYDEI